MLKVASFDGSLNRMHQNTMENYMRYCLYLAELGKGQISPNPPVGSILLHQDKIIGEGFHKKYGEAHAEVNAFASVPENEFNLIRDSTLFVSLEPCMHHGKTPPCTELILKHQIKNLVFGCFDPNPLMSGKSISFLKQQGINVTGPILESECKDQIKEFTINITRKRPYIILKFAQSADFFIGKSNEKTKISNPYTDLLVHKWRSQADGILVGSHTIHTDNPYLTTRLWPGKNPIRIALGHFSTEDRLKLNFFNSEAESWIAQELVSGDSFNLSTLVEELYIRKIGILLVEGGTKTLQSFYVAGLWDEARIITNTELYLKDGIPAPGISGSLEKKFILEKDTIHYIRSYQGD